jgi:hypothetical protein
MGEAKEVLSLQMSRAHDKEIPYVYLYISQTFSMGTRKGGERSNMKKVFKTTLLDI